MFVLIFHLKYMFKQNTQAIMSNAITLQMIKKRI